MVLIVGNGSSKVGNRYVLQTLPADAPPLVNYATERRLPGSLRIVGRSGGEIAHQSCWPVRGLVIHGCFPGNYPPDELSISRGGRKFFCADCGLRHGFIRQQNWHVVRK
jgi:hypothetical protein